MKKSEMRKILLSAGLSFALPENRPLEAAGDKALRRMEECGQSWDPEEEPLPKRLEHRGGLELWPEGQVVCEFELMRRYYAEAARRYNLLPEIERLVRMGLDPGCHQVSTADALRLIGGLVRVQEVIGTCSSQEG